MRPNQLILTVQPNEGVSLSLGAKIPGTRMRIRPVNMEFLYGTAFLSQSPEAYERLIIDAMRGDATLFTRNDEVEAQWRISTRSCRRGRRRPGPLPQYEAGHAGAGGGRPAPRGRRRLASHLMASRDARPTTSGASATRRPATIEAALRDLLVECHARERRRTCRRAC